MKGKITLILAIIFTVLTVCICAGFWFGDMTGPAYQFNEKVHGHLENAYYANQPELMKSEMLLCVQGMRDLGLENNMYAAYWSWDKIPSKKMDYQYAHMASIIDRIDSVIDWRNEVYGNNSQGGEVLGDVYEQKMDNLRGFLKEEGWSDWIANDAFYINHYLIYYLSWIIEVLMIIITAVLWILGFIWFQNE